MHCYVHIFVLIPTFKGSLQKCLFVQIFCVYEKTNISISAFLYSDIGIGSDYKHSSIGQALSSTVEAHWVTDTNEYAKIRASSLH